jgi:uncharacterized protein (DUF58 family)
MQSDNAGDLTAAVNDVMRRIYASEVHIDWRSQERRPGAGARKSRFRGTGDDYDGSKPYVPGDNTRFLDWKAYAVSGGNDLSIKTFKMTTEVTAYVLVDIAPSMDFGTTRTTKRHLAAELAGSVIRSLDETQDRVGVMVFSQNRLELSQAPRGAKAVVYPAVVAVLGTQQTAEGDGSALAQALSRLPHQRSLIYIISDFMNMSDHDWEALNRASQQHDLLCLYVQDQRERELPDFGAGGGLFGWLSSKLGGFYDLRDWTGEQRTIWVGKKTRAQYAENFRRHEAGILTEFENAHCRFTVVSTEEDEQARPKILRAIGGGR